MIDMEPRRTLAYIRVSTEMQSLERQREMIRRWSLFNEVGLNDGDWLEDDGISGGVPRDPVKRLAYYSALINDFQLHKRAGFLEMLGAIRDGKYGRVVLCEVTRLSRNTIELLLLGDILQACDCELVSLDSGGGAIVLNTASGWLNWAIKCVLAQNEVEQTRERTVQGLAAKKAAGVKLGNAPAGWMRDGVVADGKGKAFVPDPEKWAELLQVATLKDAGATLEEIAGAVEGVNSKQAARKWLKSWERRHDEGFEATPEQCHLAGVAATVGNGNDRYRLLLRDLQERQLVKKSKKKGV